jgi:hypothetical protein
VKRNRHLMLWLAVLVLAIASVFLGACGSGSSSDDKALFDKVTTMWTDQDAAAAKEIFAADANVYWNWPVQSGGPAEMTTGIDEISALVASGDMGHPTPLGDDVFTYVPSAEDVKNLTAAYDGARYIAGPVYVGRDIYSITLEVRDGKVQNQYVEAWY